MSEPRPCSQAVSIAAGEAEVVIAGGQARVLAPVAAALAAAAPTGSDATSETLERPATMGAAA